MKVSLLSLLIPACAAAPYDPSGGAAYFTTHSSLTEIDPDSHNNEGFGDDPALEYHFHVYFFQENEISVADAQRLRESIVAEVGKGSFVAVCHGVDGKRCRTT